MSSLKVPFISENVRTYHSAKMLENERELLATGEMK